LPGKFKGGQDIGNGRRRLSKVDLDEDVALALEALVRSSGAPATYHVNAAVRGYADAQNAMRAERSRPRVGARG
jgi:hypothetical protein